jgi:hypothetical protein
MNKTVYQPYIVLGIGMNRKIQIHHLLKLFSDPDMNKQ